MELINISKIYRAAHVETTALDNLCLSVAPGEFLAVMGPSGCGKSTLLNILGMLDVPSHGRFLFKGEAVESFSERRLASLRKRYLGFIFQSFHLIQELTVLENVMLPLHYLAWKERRKRQRAEAILEKLGLAHRAKHLPSQLSGGQQQRVAVARALVAGPEFILADEPTGNLDSRNGREVLDLLAQLNQEGTTVIMVTHDATQASAAHRVIHLCDGMLAADHGGGRPFRAPVGN